jgi:hypothetical protein
MPDAYEGMRDNFKRKGMSDSAAKTKAARIFNARRRPGQKPVTRYREAFAGAARRNSGGKY